MKKIVPDPNEKQVFSFTSAYREVCGDARWLTPQMRAKLRGQFGNKGACLAEMNASGVNVPPGFIIETTVCRDFHDNGAKLPNGVLDQSLQELRHLERASGRTFGDENSPLLLAIRSGAPVSMPGMLDTVPNIGLNDKTVKGLAVSMGERFALDTYRRLIQIYGVVVLGLDANEFESRLERIKARLGVSSDADLGVAPLEALIRDYKAYVKEKSGAPFPQDVHAQLAGAVEAVLRSWNNKRAVFYRKKSKIDDKVGTAVIVQSMVFGNLNCRSGTGVCFTRNPNTGEKQIFGEYLARAQGTDLVGGSRTPESIEKLAVEMPEVFAELVRTAERLEATFHDMQEIEWTVEDGKLYILQTRKGKATCDASVRIAVALVEEGKISRDEALSRVKAEQLDQFLVPRFAKQELAEAKAAGRLLASGSPAVPGAAVGKIIFSPEEAAILGSRGEQIVLVRIDTEPGDIHGISAAKAIVTARGGMTSHAAVVARDLGKPCVTACEELRIDLTQELVEIDGVVLHKNDIISVSGTTGEIFAGALQSIQVELEPHIEKFLSWRDH